MAKREVFRRKKPFFHFLSVVALVSLSKIDPSSELSLKNKYHIFRTPLLLKSLTIFTDADSCYTCAAYASENVNGAFTVDDVYATEVFAIIAAVESASTVAHSTDVFTYAADAATYAANYVDPKIIIELFRLSIIEDNSHNLLFTELFTCDFTSIPVLADLHFLADDLNQLVDFYKNNTNTLSPERLTCYQKQISQAAFQTPELLEEAFTGKGISHFIRTLIVGNGGSGKTTLFQLLTTQTVVKQNPANLPT